MAESGNVEGERESGFLLHRSFYVPDALFDFSDLGMHLPDQVMFDIGKLFDSAGLLSQ